MPFDTRIMRQGRAVPVVTFFGAKGGVGKTTVSKRFAELVTLAESAPNVLLVDGDVFHHGMTTLMKQTSLVSCKTLHDYVASRNTSIVEAARLTVEGAQAGSGQLFFVPASEPEADHVFAKEAEINPEELLQILYDVVAKAVEKYDCSCVVIDCGPIIDPYTATSAMLADRAFVIGQNEPISFASLQSLPKQIKEFHPDFAQSKINLIVNKVRGWEMLEERRQLQSIFAAIPFTLDIVDASEGLGSTNQMQMMIFEDHIAQIIEKTFKGDHLELIPAKHNMLPPEWGSLVQNPENLERAPAIKRLGMLRLLLPIGLLVLVVGGVVAYIASSQRHRSERAMQAQELVVTVKSALADAESSAPAVAAPLREALQLAQIVDPADEQSLNRAVKGAQEAGVKEVPALKRQDTSQENLGIGVLLVGIIVGGVGFSCSRSRKNYLSAIKGLRKGGAQWLMSEMKAKKSSRKTFDRLLKIAQRA